MDEFHSKKLARKKRVKWWGDHLVLAYVTATGIFTLIYIAAASIYKHLPDWLASLGVNAIGGEVDYGDAFVRTRPAGHS